MNGLFENMERGNLRELHYITAIDNLASISRLGILSHNRARRIDHVSVALEEIQVKRANKTIPQGGRLHDYVNIYFNARNPMLYRLIMNDKNVCVLKINEAIIDLPGTIITDRNASSGWARFYPAETGLAHIDEELIYARNWTNPDNQVDEWRRKSCICAEVLIPDRVDIEWISGIYVPCEDAARQARAAWPSANVIINSDLFFR